MEAYWRAIKSLWSSFVTCCRQRRWTMRRCEPRATLERGFDRGRGRAANAGIELGIACNNWLIGSILENLRAALAL